MAQITAEEVCLQEKELTNTAILCAAMALIAFAANLWLLSCEKYTPQNVQLISLTGFACGLATTAALVCFFLRPFSKQILEKRAGFEK